MMEQYRPPPLHALLVMDSLQSKAVMQNWMASIIIINTSILSTAIPPTLLIAIIIAMYI